VTRPPRGLLFDYGGTLVEEVEDNPRAGTEAILRHATNLPAALDREAIFARAERVSREVAGRRDATGIETPWTSLTRLIHDFFGIRFAVPLTDLELAFWDASVRTRAMPGARDALLEFQRAGLPMGVVSNSSFGQRIIRHELAKHGLADALAVVVVSAEYAVRKPNPLLFETAAALLGVAAREVWFVGDRLDTDIAGARAAGMIAVWFPPSTEARRTEADLVAPTWGALAAMVRGAMA
jgi:putative hydrolase of the HAD superfamily